MKSMGEFEYECKKYKLVEYSKDVFSGNIKKFFVEGNYIIVI